MEDNTVHRLQQFPTMPEAWSSLLSNLIISPYEETNERTGSKIKTLFGGVAFTLDLTDRRIPVVATRKLFPRSAAAEAAWFMSGSKSVEWLEKYSKIWSKFVNDDDPTIIDGAYGYRWRNHFGRDQIASALVALIRNPSDRRILVSAWDPSSDGLGNPSKNVPCPASFTLSIVGGCLHSSLFIRSSDVFVGLPYDVMVQSMLMSIFATTLDLEIGTLQVTLAHPHLYEAHYEMAYKCISAPASHLTGPFAEGPIMQPFSLRAVESNPDDFVEAYVAESAECSWPEYCPRPEVIV